MTGILEAAGKPTSRVQGSAVPRVQGSAMTVTAASHLVHEARGQWDDRFKVLKRLLVRILQPAKLFFRSEGWRN